MAIIKTNASITLNEQLLSNPFSYIFLANMPVALLFEEKVLFIDELKYSLSKLESNIDTTLTRYHWLRIISGFSASLTIAGSTAIAPLLGTALSVTSVVSAVAAVTTTIVSRSQLEPLNFGLKRYRLALSTLDSLQWAILWEISGSEAFLGALDRASDGIIIRGELRHLDGATPWDKAIEYARKRTRLSEEQILKQGKEIKERYERGFQQLSCETVPTPTPQDSLTPVNPVTLPTPQDSLPQTHETLAVPASEPQPQLVAPLKPEQWAHDLMAYPSILIHGAQGAGKTSTAAWLVRERIKGGHQVKILDPHREYGQWNGLTCIGDGMDYEAIDAELEAFTAEIKKRYKERAVTPNYNPPKLTLLCDEFTQWAKKCEHAPVFFEETLTDIRKINLHVIYVSHARTLTGLGGSKGLAATRDAGLLELELEAQVDPTTKKASPKLQGWLKYPGKSMSERQRVAIAPWMNGSMDFSEFGSTEVEELSQTSIDDLRTQLETLLNHPGSSPEVKPEGHSSHPEVSGSSEPEAEAEVEVEANSEDFSSGSGSGSEANVERIKFFLQKGLTITDAIDAAHGVRSGRRFQKIRNQYKQATGE